MITSLPQQMIKQAAQIMATPLAPSRYLETLNPMWSNHARGQVIAVYRESQDAVTLDVRPNKAWPQAQPGQYVQIGVDIDGVRHWRCYSLTRVPEPHQNEFSITVRQIKGGHVSTYINKSIRAGAVIHLRPAAGEFVLPESSDQPLLMISAGSGVTPMMGMLRQISEQRPTQNVVLLHFTPDYQRCLFTQELKGFRQQTISINLSLTQARPQDDDISGHFSAKLLEQVCPDWQTRQAYVCGPQSLLSAVKQHWLKAGLSSQLQQEAFVAEKTTVSGVGGQVTFSRSDKIIQANGDASLLEQAEEAGLAPEHGCRMGICCGCLATLEKGQVKDTSSGDVFSDAGDKVKLCVCVPAGDATLDI